MLFQLRFTNNSVGGSDDIEAYESLGFVYNKDNRCFDGKPIIKIDTMEEFKELLVKCNNEEFVIGRNVEWMTGTSEPDYVLEIYNDYRE